MFDLKGTLNVVCGLQLMTSVFLNPWLNSVYEKPAGILPVRKRSMLSLWVILSRPRPEYVARVGSAP